VVGGDHLDLPALGEQAGILDRHLRGDGRAGTADIGIEAGLVAETSHLDDLVERLRKSAGGKNQGRGYDQGRNGSLHLSSRNFF
jgi:ClpP class serine protease